MLMFSWHNWWLFSLHGKTMNIYFYWFYQMWLSFSRGLWGFWKILDERIRISDNYSQSITFLNSTFLNRWIDKYDSNRWKIFEDIFLKNLYVTSTNTRNFVCWECTQLTKNETEILERIYPKIKVILDKKVLP